MELIEKVKNFPNKPGIYKFYSKNRIVYVGKSKSLRTRVLSYFRPNHEREKIFVMMEFVDDVDYEETPSHLEARLLEYSYIRHLQPMYNAQFKMEKTAYYLNLDEKKLLSTSLEGTYGPFLGARFLRDFIKFINNLYPIKLREGIFEFDYQILEKRLSPSERKETYEALSKTFQDPRLLEKFQIALSGKMLLASKAFKFELAQKYKMFIDAFSYIKETIIDKHNFLESSVLIEEDEHVLLIHKGRLIKSLTGSSKDFKLEYLLNIIQNFDEDPWRLPYTYTEEMKSICYSEFKDSKIYAIKM